MTEQREGKKKLEEKGKRLTMLILLPYNCYFNQLSCLIGEKNCTLRFFSSILSKPKLDIAFRFKAQF